MTSRRGLKKLKVLLFPLVKEDKIYIFDFDKRLMKETIKFMRDCRKKFKWAEQDGAVDQGHSGPIEK